jgi:O-antigen/teichoic acid export membrane protein
MGIEAFLLSTAVFNVALLIIIAPRYIFNLHLSLRQINKKDISLLFEYGKMGLFINVCSSLLVSSDRFLIERFSNIKNVGIYNQNYNITQITISTLVSVYWSSLSPFILRVLGGKRELVKKTVYAYFDLYFLLALPLCIYAMLYAKQIAEIMLGENFRAGYPIIAWVAISEFFIGLLFIPSMKLKLDNKLKILSLYYFSALTINIGLNIFCIRQFGYLSAAIVNAIVYLILLLCVYRHDVFNCFPQLLRTYKFKLCASILTLEIAFHIVSARFDLSVYYYVTEGVLSALIYSFFAIRNKWISLRIQAS